MANQSVPASHAFLACRKSDRRVDSISLTVAHRWGDTASLLALAADRTSATPPHALGLAMDVPFMSCRACCVLHRHLPGSPAAANPEQHVAFGPR